MVGDKLTLLTEGAKRLDELDRSKAETAFGGGTGAADVDRCRVRGVAEGYPAGGDAEAVGELTGCCGASRFVEETNAPAFRGLARFSLGDARSAP